MIPVTKSYLPSKEKYQSYVDQIYASGWLTNNGPLVQKLEERLSKYLGVKHVICVANGSLALQLSYKALGLKGEVITTPFSFVATASTLVWEGLKPIFADINPYTYNLDPQNIEKLITKETSAIVPVHVFGNPCEVEKIQEIANKHNLKVVYDAAHAFGAQYKGGSVLSYGDISTLSFHATKIFHTIEGGAVITNNDEIANKVRLLINFGIASPASIKSQGINAKMNEFEAAMGLCNLDEIENINTKRSKIWNKYQKELTDHMKFQQWNPYGMNNYAYTPVLLDSESKLLKVEAVLKENNIVPRRYFYPSLDTLDSLKEDPNAASYTKQYSFNNDQVCEVSRDIASRILCLPIYPGLSENSQVKICQVLRGVSF
jgi:dTDP-4-amino-4,6-dideoxygalactose transaminase